MNDRVLTIPNALTLARILLAPLVLMLVFQHAYLAALCVFVLGALTDHLDGFLARKLNQVSHLGSLLDPVADKIYVLLLIPLLWQMGLVPFYFTLLVIIRYTAQLSVFPVLHGWRKRPFKVAPQWLPKFATALAFLVIGMGLLQLTLGAATPEAHGARKSLFYLTNMLTVVGALLEAYVLATFLPRYWQIFKGTHDTFE